MGERNRIVSYLQKYQELRCHKYYRRHVFAWRGANILFDFFISIFGLTYCICNILKNNFNHGFYLNPLLGYICGTLFVPGGGRKTSPHTSTVHLSITPF